jgi:zinc and cadmium transporter
MTPSWLAPLLAAIVVSSAALLGSGAILLLRSRAERASGWLLSFAVGTLLAAATMGLLPEAVERSSLDRVMPRFLAGILIFIAIERVLRWRHPHEGRPGQHLHPPIERATVSLILWSDAIHNFVDGVLLGVAYHVGLETGIGATIAVFAHEVPQEVGDFALLLGAGVSRKRAVRLNYLSSVTIVPGALVSSVWASASAGLVSALLPIAAGGFIYIALADLVPSLHHRRGARAGLLQLALILAGVAIIAGLELAR